MIKRTLHFSNPAHLSTKKNQMVVNFPDERMEVTVPIEDVGIIVLEHRQITISHTLITHLLGNNVALVTCDSHHLPQGMMLNLNGHSQQQEHFRHQVAATEAMKARMWQQTVKAKILNQAALLKANSLDTENMERWASKVKPGDPDNLEARAAANYWKKLFTDQLQDFKRGRYEGEPNNLLNYGYAILRAVIARALIGSGLLPTLGYHHRNKYNAYCLADDVMEPYRPFVDQLVVEMVRTEEDYGSLTPDLKKKLLQVPVLDVHIRNQTSPLMLAAQQTTKSVYQYYEKTGKTIQFPRL
ncbi:type II CRISPR-associated endonuclease Cas1 [Ekhidna sp.]|jgi:CRISPR-associated protein Cas1|uniref:type II CRISPR-associated endonuclease Cas1 n=1 Tax=Ekhidna sp. TaxID=2608089 RepID=UPI0032EAE6BE